MTVMIRYFNVFMTVKFECLVNDGKLIRCRQVSFRFTILNDKTMPEYRQKCYLLLTGHSPIERPLLPDGIPFHFLR